MMMWDVIIMFDDWITDNVKSVLLVEPNFPIPNKSRNHKNFLPIGLLKIAAYLRTKNIDVKLIRFDNDDFIKSNELNLDYFANSEDIIGDDDFVPDLICVTSIFTYWAKHVKYAVSYYKRKYKDVPVIVGGIYASLMPQQCKEYTGCDDVIFGVIEGAEKVIPAYDLVDVDYQIIHTTRGCIRRCGACGVYQIEPEWSSKKSIKDEIVKKKIIFYDNNILANPFIEDILNELIELKKERKITYVESQSGFDGRILRKNPHLGKMIKDAGFKNPKIAWDGPFSDWKKIKKQIDILVESGFDAKEISVFMLYNHELNYDVLESKRVKCFEWGVQITDCRFRPLDEIKDNYSPHKRNGQTRDDYFIHENWTDEAVRKFRRNVRRNNICVRHGVDFHSSILERKKIPQEEAKILRELPYDEVKDKLPDAWTPAIFHKIEEQDYFKMEGGK